MTFLDLCKPENIERMNIDERLVPAFKNVMRKLHNFFEANGYYQSRNYSELIESRLLSGDDNSFNFIISQELSLGIDGLYDAFNTPPSIKVASYLVEGVNGVNQNRLEEVICHEFIHFLVMTDTKYTWETIRGSFFNEALTELLNQQIYPGSKSYMPQVKFQQFANFLMDTTNDFRSFLRGHVPGIISSATANNMEEALKKYSNDPNISITSMQDAAASEDYRKGLKYLLDLFYSPVSKKLDQYSVEEYLNLTSNILIMCPVMGQVVNDFLEKMDYDYIMSIFPRHQLQLSHEMVDFFEKQLKLYREINISKNEGYLVSDSGLFKIKIDRKEPSLITKITPIRGNATRLVRNSNSRTRDYYGTFSNEEYPNCTYKVEGQQLYLYDQSGTLIDSLSITPALFDIPQNVNQPFNVGYEQFRQLLSPKAMRDAKIGNKIIAEHPELLHIQKIALLSPGNQIVEIYLATTTDGIIIYNSGGHELILAGMEPVQDIEISLYKGITAKQNGLIMVEKLGVLPKAYKSALQVYRSEIPVIIYFDGQKYTVATEKNKNSALLGYSKMVYNPSENLAVNQLVTQPEPTPIMGR